MSPWTVRVWNTCLVAGFLMGGGVAYADPFTVELIADLEASGFQVNEGYPKVGPDSSKLLAPRIFKFAPRR